MENIRGIKPIDDFAYRYKMPIMTIKVEGNKILLSNLEKIGKALHRDTDELHNYFGFTLSTTKKKVDNNYYIQGKVELSELQKKLYEYIEYFVLCDKCKLPETLYKVDDKNSELKKNCAACGSTSSINHKFSKNVLKNNLKNEK